MSSESAHERFIEPIWTLLRVLGLFIDVATLMIRLLFNTILYDTPHGKKEISSGGDQ